MPANSGESRAFLLKKIRANRSHLSGETLMARSGIGEDNRGSANLNAAILEPSAGWHWH